MTFSLLNIVAIPQWLLTRYMVPLASVQKLWGFLKAESDRITK